MSGTTTTLNDLFQTPQDLRIVINRLARDLESAKTDCETWKTIAEGSIDRIIELETLEEEAKYLLSVGLDTHLTNYGRDNEIDVDDLDDPDFYPNQDIISNNRPNTTIVSVDSSDDDIPEDINVLNSRLTDEMSHNPFYYNDAYDLIIDCLRERNTDDSISLERQIRLQYGHYRRHNVHQPNF